LKIKNNFLDYVDAICYDEDGDLACVIMEHWNGNHVTYNQINFFDRKVDENKELIWFKKRRT